MFTDGDRGSTWGTTAVCDSELQHQELHYGWGSASLLVLPVAPAASATSEREDQERRQSR